MNSSINGHFKQSNPNSLWVWYQGTDYLSKGEAVCYNTDYGTASAADGRRANLVERPHLTNNTAFAGVAARDYPASATPQLVEIYGPGSMGVEIALTVDTTINTGILTFVAGPHPSAGIAGQAGAHRGRFYTGKFLGRGSAIPRQTKTAIRYASMTGAWSLATDGKTLTVSDTTGTIAGDFIVFFGSKDEGTSKAIIPGKYVVASITSGTVLVLTQSAVGATPAGALTCTGCCIAGNPTCIADLLDGNQSGGLEFISPLAAGLDTTTYMVGGLSYVCGGVTLAADVECDFAQGTYFGEEKAFWCLGTLTTNDFVVDLVTAGVQLDRTGTTAVVLALAEVQLDAAGEGCFLKFNGAKWHLQDLIGAAAVA